MDKTYLPRTEKLLANPEALCNMVRRIAIEAGEITLKYFDGIKDMGVERKADNSPVTLADQEAEILIQKALAELTPDIPFIGEELTEAGNAPTTVGESYYWLVDALDGTREFIKGNEEYTVNIALMHNHKPVMGVVYAPAKGDLYAGFGAGSALHWNMDSDNQKKIYVRKVPEKGLTIVSSASHTNNPKLQQFLEGFKVCKVVRYGSSLKICAIAAGKADMYPRFGLTCHWDTAAAQAVLEAAGGVLVDMHGAPLPYGDNDHKRLNPEFIASSFSVFEVDD